MRHSNDHDRTPSAPGRVVRVLVVDDSRIVRDTVRLWLDSRPGISVVGEASNGAEAVRVAQAVQPDVVLMDVDMPAMSGAEATAHVLERCPTAAVVAYTGHVSPMIITDMIVAGATGYAVKGQDPTRLETAVRAAARGEVPIDQRAIPGIFGAVVRLARQERERRREGERLHEELMTSYGQTVRAFAAALDMRDDATQEHVDRVARRARSVAELLGLEGDQLRDAEYGGLFHDVGKIGVPDSILLSDGALGPAEWAIIRRHTIYGEQILSKVGFLRRVARIVRHSHEHWDGSGYPDALRGTQIPIESRIVLACDAFDVMTGGRRYQAPLSIAVAMSRMRRAAGSHFDPLVVRALEQVVRDELVDRRTAFALPDTTQRVSH